MRNRWQNVADYPTSESVPVLSGWPHTPYDYTNGRTCQQDGFVWPCPSQVVLDAERAASAARIEALREAIEGLRKDHGAQNRIGVLGPDGRAGAWAALGAVLAYLNGRPIAPPPFDPEEYAARAALTSEAHRG